MDLLIQMHNNCRLKLACAHRFKIYADFLLLFVICSSLILIGHKSFEGWEWALIYHK